MPNVLHLRVAAGTGGGPEKTILNSPRFIRPFGYDASVVYLCPPKSALADSLRDRAIAAECPMTILDDHGPRDWRVIREIIRICRRQKIDILQTHDYKSNAIGLIARRFHRCSLASMLHGWTDMTGRMPLYKRIDQWCLPHYQSLICVSEDLVQECARLKIPENRIHLVHNAIDTNYYRRTQSKDAAKSSMNARRNRFLIGSIGRLSPEKGYSELIEVVVQLQHSGMAIDLWIAGEGPQRSELEAQITRHRANESIRLLGQMQETRPFYEAMDLFVLNSVREGLPNVILEAMAMEVPIVATAIAGIPTLIDSGMTGILIPADNRQSLERAIIEAIQRPADQSLFAGRARLRVQSEFSFDKRMERIAGIYDRLLTPSTPS